MAPSETLASVFGMRHAAVFAGVPFHMCNHDSSTYDDFSVGFAITVNTADEPLEEQEC